MDHHPERPRPNGFLDRHPVVVLLIALWLLSWGVVMLGDDPGYTPIGRLRGEIAGPAVIALALATAYRALRRLGAIAPGRDAAR